MSNIAIITIMEGGAILNWLETHRTHPIHTFLPSQETQKWKSLDGKEIDITHHNRALDSYPQVKGDLTSTNFEHTKT